MYAETGLIFPYFQNFSQEVQHLDEFCRSHTSISPFGSQVQTSTISDYDLGGEGDLFKAPEPIIEEPTMAIDPMTAAISMISCGEDISPQTLEVANFESIQNEQFLSEVFYECKKDLLAKDAIETPLSDILDIKLPNIGTIDGCIPEDQLFSEGLFSKHVSLGCLSSTKRGQRFPMRPTFLDFPKEDLATVYGMRRAFSEGDIKTHANNNVNIVHSPQGLPQYHGSWASEDRLQKLSRYRDKKSKRKFGRTIKGRTCLYCNLLSQIHPLRNMGNFQSMLAGRLWLIISRGFVEDLQRHKNQNSCRESLSSVEEMRKRSKNKTKTSLWMKITRNVRRCETQMRVRNRVMLNKTDL